MWQELLVTFEKGNFLKKEFEVSEISGRCSFIISFLLWSHFQLSTYFFQKNTKQKSFLSHWRAVQWLKAWTLKPAYLGLNRGFKSCSSYLGELRDLSVRRVSVSVRWGEGDSLYWGEHWLCIQALLFTNRKTLEKWTITEAQCPHL